MQIKLPYFYEIIHRRDDWHTATRPQMGFVTCEISEPDAAEIVPAARWKRGSHDHPLEINCLSWRGDLYLQRTTSGYSRHLKRDDLEQAHLGGILRLESLGAFLDPLVGGPNRHYHLYQWLQNRRQFFARPGGGTVTFTTEETDAERLRTVARRTIVHEGFVFQRVSNLRCNIYSQHSPGSLLVNADFDYTLNDGASWNRVWDGESHYWADGCSISLNDIDLGLRWGGEELRTAFHDLEVFQPEAFAFDERALYLSRVIAKFVKETGHVAGSWSAVLLEEYLALRRETENAPMDTESTLARLEALRLHPIGKRAVQVIDEGFKGFEKLEKLLQSKEQIATLSTSLRLG